MSEPETMQINNVKYVRADAQRPVADELDGLPYVVVRSRDQGVMVGYLQEQTPQTVTLLRARQVWQWKSKFVLAEFAEFGPTGDGKISAALSQPFDLANWCGVYRCTAKAGEAIRAIEAFEP